MPEMVKLHSGMNPVRSELKLSSLPEKCTIPENEKKGRKSGPVDTQDVS